jgi:altronate hydrolase
MGRSHLPQCIRLHRDDNIVIAREGLSFGTQVLEEGITCRSDIPAGHKVATARISSSNKVLRYGEIIGIATADIEPGEHVHTHNLTTAGAERIVREARQLGPTALVKTPATFSGILRADGRVGTRNYVGLLATVNCAGTVVRGIADHFRRTATEWTAGAIGKVDGVVGLSHTGGCGIDPAGYGLKLLRRTLTGYLRHPNFHSVILVGLGCETNQLREVLEDEAPSDADRVSFLEIQQSGGTRRAIAAGIELVQQLLVSANTVTRVDCPASGLVVGLQCGGSDGYSGISANPALGAAVDLLVSHGGTAILSETPEIIGAEHLLMGRAASPEVARRLQERLEWWTRHCANNGASVDNNPSAGNKSGGITTVLEKALGGIAKGGSTRLEDVYEYAQRVSRNGLTFMDTPGYDPVSATGQVAFGANLICFTTGRGSAYGCKPTPSLKLASNTELWRRQEDDIDVNCGEIVDGTATVEEMGKRIFDLMINVASGQPTKSEELGYGQEEFVPWQPSVVT